MAKMTTMNEVSIDILLSAIDCLLAQPMCIQVWRGYGSVLFVGFGKEYLTPTKQRRDGSFLHPIPPYELQVYCSQWSVDGFDGMLKDPPKHLVGRQLIKFDLVNDVYRIKLLFGNGSLLSIEPELTANEDDEIWGIRLPDGKYLIVLHSGRVVMG